jgi:hypothetical protein
MKKIGIMGGVAWLSTVEYYSELCRRSEEWWLRSGRPGPPATPAAEWIRMPLPHILADGTTARPEHPYKSSVPKSSAIYEKDLTTTKVDGRI